MYAIVKTGGKQYKVAPGDIIEIEKIDAEAGTKIALDAICIIDGENVEADPAKAASTKVSALVIEQFKGDKQLVFKFKKRKNYKKLNGHRQRLTRVQIESVGSEKAPVKKTATKKPVVEKAAPAEKKPAAAKKAPAAKAAAAKKPTAEKPAAEKKPAAKAAKPAAKKPAAKKPVAKKADVPAADAE
jgi:large subunit ribosomal protein L21